MKIYVVVETYSDEDGNINTDLHKCSTEAEAVKTVREIHDRVLKDYSDYYDGMAEVDDSYDDGDLYCVLSLADDYDVRTIVTIQELDV